MPSIYSKTNSGSSNKLKELFPDLKEAVLLFGENVFSKVWVVNIVSYWSMLISSFFKKFSTSSYIVEMPPML